MCLNWGKIYIWGLLVLSFTGSAIPTNWYFSAFFIWFVNYESYFWHFEICGRCLNSTRYFALSFIGKLISTSSPFFFATFCWSVNCMSWMSLNYKICFRHLKKLKNYLYLRPFYLFSFKDSSVLTIKDFFNFFWSLNCASLVCKLYVLIWTILDFWAVLILGLFIVAYSKRYF